MLDKIFNPAPTIYKWDRFWVGFIPGMLGPLLGIVFFYFLTSLGMPFHDYLITVRHPYILPKVLSFGALVNLFIFFLFIWNNRYNAARGVIGATIIYIIPIIVTKFFM